MFSSELKSEIADKVQKVLQETKHPELPDGEIQLLLHVDGAEGGEWANIRNNNPAPMDLAHGLVRNLTV